MEPTDRIDDEAPGDDPVREDEERWADWPRCPGCGRRRRTRCPTCDGGSDDFPLADFIPAAESLPASGGCSSCGPVARSGPPSSGKDFDVLLMCPECEEAFSPRFYRLCEQCGHDFGEGLLIEPAGSDRTNDRVMLVLAGLIALGAVVVAYFWYLFA